MSFPLKGKVIAGKYQFVELLGSGGMSEIWKAKRLNLEDYVAIKCLPSDAYAEEKEKEKLAREGRNMSALNHPNICKIHDLVEDSLGIFLVMELLDGYDLSQLIQLSKTYSVELDLKVSTYIVNEVFTALAYAHNLNLPELKKILHRDIKPSNIFITKYGEIKLLDLGISKKVTNSKEETTKSVEFSIPYTCYDLWDEDEYKSNTYAEKHDLFSLGLVFYELVTGTRAYTGNGVQLIQNIKNNNISLETLPSSSLKDMFSEWLNIYEPNNQLELEKLPISFFELLKSQVATRNDIIEIVSEIDLKFKEDANEITVRENHISSTVNKDRPSRKLVYIGLFLSFFLATILIYLIDPFRMIQKQSEITFRYNLPGMNYIVDFNQSFSDIKFPSDISCTDLPLGKMKNCSAGITISGAMKLRLTLIFKGEILWRATAVGFDGFANDLEEDISKITKNIKNKSKGNFSGFETTIVSTEGVNIEYSRMHRAFTTVITRKE